MPSSSAGATASEIVEKNHIYNEVENSCRGPYPAGEEIRQFVSTADIIAVQLTLP